MTKKAKKVTLGVAALLAVSFGAIGVASKIASAADVTVTISQPDTLGNLDWTAVTGATGYEVSYTVGDETVSFATESNTANVGVALTKAVKLAQENYQEGDMAKVSFEVTPIGVEATAGTLDYEFDTYIDYGYSTHDITEYNTDAAQSYGHMFGGNSNTGYYDETNANYVDNYSTAFKNNLLTLGLNRLTPNTSSGSYKTEIGLFGAQGSTLANYNYQISISTTGNGLTVTAGTTTVTKTETEFETILNASNYETMTLAGDSYQGVKNNHASYKIFADTLYLTLGVFDCYGLDGIKVSEKFYMTGQKTTASGLSDLGIVEMEVKDALSYTMSPGSTSSTGSTGMANVLVDKSTMMISSTYVRHWLTSGVVEEKPTNLYYDNVDATMNWNAVENATGYEYAIGDGEWTATTDTYADVKAALTEYESVGYLPFKVRAVTDGVKGATASYSLDLDRFYNARSTVKDLFEFYGEFNYDGTNSKYSQGSDIKLGTRICYSFECDGTTIQHIALLGATQYHTSYDLWIYSNPDENATTYGYVALWRNSSGINSKTGRWLDDCWRGLKANFETGKTYFVTYGVDDVFENVEGEDTKVAERVFLRLYDENNQTILATTFDNTQCFETDDDTTDIVENAANNSTNAKYDYILYTPVASTIVYEKGDYSITLDGKIGVNAYMNISAAHRSTVAKMTMNIACGEETNTIALPTKENGAYKFTHYVPVKDIDKEIAFELVIGEKESNVVYTLTARNYIDQVQAGGVDVYGEKLVDLVNAIEYYCDAAIEFYDDDVDTTVKFEEVTADKFKAMVVDGTSETVKGGSLSLLIEEDTTIRLYIQATATPTVKVGNQALDVIAVDGFDGYYYVEIANISGFDLAEIYEFSINGEMTVTCSALSYGALVMEKSNDVELQNVVKALYNYSQAAAAYNDASAQ